MIFFISFRYRTAMIVSLWFISVSFLSGRDKSPVLFPDKLTFVSSNTRNTEGVFLVNPIRPFPAGLPTCLEDDFRELEKLYDATGGDNWTNKAEWFTNSDMTQWYGITLTMPLGCDVGQIELQNNNLQGTLPTLNLPNLDKLLLDNNLLIGGIPNFSTTNLSELSLGDNQLSGVIPDFNLPQLASLTLSNNQLTGTVPNFTQTNLHALWLGNNQLTGSIPYFTLPQLEFLGLSNNQLTGTIPNFSQANLTMLLLNDNQLTGTIPNFNLSRLEYLGLSNNQFSGTVTNFNLPQLEYLELSNNRFTGIIPNFNLPLLQSLSIDNNKFVFENIVGKTWLNITELNYAPQAKIPLTFTGGLLTTNTGSANNVQQFEWYRDGELIATNQSNTFAPTNTGTYYCKITHNTVTIPDNDDKNLILQSENYIHTAVLPVELLSFTAHPLSKNVKLKWSTASEKNSHYFEVQRSMDGKVFDKIGQVAARGNSTDVNNYLFLDEKPLNKVNYYRLRQIDSDGKAQLSNIVSVEFDVQPSLSVFPNPAIDKLTILSEPNNAYLISDMVGRTILRGYLSDKQTEVDVSTLLSGFYIVQLKNISVKFFKQ